MKITYLLKVFDADTDTEIFKGEYLGISDLIEDTNKIEEQIGKYQEELAAKRDADDAGAADDE